MKSLDGGASPHIVQKDVILCRSGIQLYHKSEIASFITHDNKPAQDKEWYREYRPAAVVVKAKELCSALPVAREHPNDWITPRNFRDLAGGVTGTETDIVALDGEGEGEIGIKTSVTFFTDELYDYYMANNKEVSLGYTCSKHFVPNPDEVGYDIILDSIDEVNHLAITRGGRGGSSVAVIDSIIGGMKQMRTGIWSWLKSKKQADGKEEPFGTRVFAALRESNGKTGDEVAQGLKGVLDSCADIKDGEAKATLLDMVRDCCDSRERALENEKEISSVLDSLYARAVSESVESVQSSVSVSDSDAGKAQKDGDGKEDKKDGKEDKKDGKEDKKDGKEDKKDGKEGDDGNKDTAPSATDSKPLTADDVRSIVKECVSQAVRDSVPVAVRATLGIKDDKDGAVGAPEGGQVDSVPAFTRDYSEFLDI